MNRKNIWNVIKRYKFKSVFLKYFVLNFIIVILPAIIFGSVFMIYCNNYFNRQAEEEAKFSADIINNNYKNHNQSIASLYSFVSTDSTVLNYLLKGQYENHIEMSNAVENIKKSLKSICVTDEYLNAYLYNFKQEYVISIDSSNYIEMFYDQGWINLYRDNNFKDCVLPRKYTTVFNTINVLTIVRNIYYGDYLCGALVFNVDMKELIKNISAEDMRFDELNITDSSSKVIISNNMEHIGENLEYIEKQYSLQRNGYIYIKQYNSEDNYYLLTKSRNKYLQHLKIYNILTIIIMLIVILGSMTFSYFISKNNYGSIVDIMEMLSDNCVDELNMEGDEFQYISQNIQSIKETGKRTENQLSEKLQQLKISQMYALQNQINPHFIFNTLNLVLIKDRAEHKMPTEISRIITLMSTLLHSVLDAPNYMVTLRVELDNLMKYVELQNIRHKNACSIYISCDEAYLDSIVIKFMLQPIVENAIIHGILLKPTKKGSIKILVHENSGGLNISVIDDGVGMDGNRLQEVREYIGNEKMVDKHIGLHNVNRRIKIAYGEEYGISINSNSDGTEVNIILPKL